MVCGGAVVDIVFGACGRSRARPKMTGASRQTRRRRAIPRVAAVLLGLAAWHIPALADSTTCGSDQTCLAAAESKRWTELAQAVQASAQELRRVREALRNAEREGDTAGAARLRAEQVRAQADWDAKQQLADAVTGERYRNFLLERGAELDTWAAQSNDVLQMTVMQIRELNQALREQNQTDVQRLEEAAREQQRAVDAALWDATRGLIRRRIEQARAARLVAPPADTAVSPEARLALAWERVEAVYPKLETIDLTQAVQDGALCAAVGQTGLLLWEGLAPGGPPAPLTVDASAVVWTGKLSGDLTDLAIVHAYFEARGQPPASSAEAQQQLEIERVRRVAALARAERDRALDALVRQAGLEDQLKLIRARLNR